MRSGSYLLKVFLACILIGLASQKVTKLNRVHLRTVQKKHHPNHRAEVATTQSKPSASLISIATAIGKFAKALPKKVATGHGPNEKSHSESSSSSSSSSSSHSHSHPHCHDHEHHHDDHHHNHTCNDTNDTNDSNDTNGSQVISLIAGFFSQPKLHVDPPKPKPKTPLPVVGTVKIAPAAAPAKKGGK